ncbi:MAG: helix-turn-helix domain-containing protein, partial [Bacteroidia bacterium]|nr:helix-turn-helix domain-containing protein [Bacteroidia bacterium]
QSADKPEYIDQQLSEREEAILKLICIEKTNQEIADDLGISRNTVNTYRTRMIDKLGVKNSIGLVLYAIKKGIHRL